MFRFDLTKLAKEKFYDAKNSIKIWDVDVSNIVVSRLIKTKTNYKYLIRYLDEVITTLVLTLPETGGYAKTFKDKDGNKDNELMFLRIDDKKLLEKYEVIWTKIDYLKKIKLYALLVYDDRYIKHKEIMHGDKVYMNIPSLNVPEYGVECESLTVISIDSLLVHENKYCL